MEVVSYFNMYPFLDIFTAFTYSTLWSFLTFVTNNVTMFLITLYSLLLYNESTNMNFVFKSERSSINQCKIYCLATNCYCRLQFSIEKMIWYSILNILELNVAFCHNFTINPRTSRITGQLCSYICVHHSSYS